MCEAIPGYGACSIIPGLGEVRKDDVEVVWRDRRFFVRNYSPELAIQILDLYDELGERPRVLDEIEQRTGVGRRSISTLLDRVGLRMVERRSRYVYECPFATRTRKGEEYCRTIVTGFPPKVVHECIRLYVVESYSTREVMKRTGVNSDTVHAWLERLKLTRSAPLMLRHRRAHQRGFRDAEHRDRTIIEAYQDKQNMRGVARDLNLHFSLVRRIINRHNIPLLRTDRTGIPNRRKKEVQS